MVFIDWFVVIVANLLPSGLLETGKQISHVFGERGLIPLDGQHVIGLLTNNRLGNLSLTSHSVNCDHTPVYIQYIEQFRNSRHFVRFVIDFALT